MRCEEILGMMLLTWVNLAYYQELMAGMRAAIAEGRFDDFRRETKENWSEAARAPDRSAPRKPRAANSQGDE